jgi:hypothetical protein
MTDYKNVVVEQSKQRASEVLAAIRQKRNDIAALEKEYAQVIGVLKALDAANTLGIHTEAQAILVKEGDTFRYQCGGQNYNLFRSAMDAVEALGEFRTDQVRDALTAHPGYAGKSHPSITAYARFYIGALLAEGRIERTSRGCYKAVNIPTEKPLPKVKDDTGNDVELNLVDGVVTTEKRPERGYGTR